MRNYACYENIPFKNMPVNALSVNIFLEKYSYDDIVL